MSHYQEHEQKIQVKIQKIVDNLANNSQIKQYSLLTLRVSTSSAVMLTDWREIKIFEIEFKRVFISL